MRIKTLLAAIAVSAISLGANAQQPGDSIVPCDANNLAQYLAGKSNEKFASIQGSDHYQKYSKESSETWDELNQRLLNPIQKWSADSIPEFYNDSTTCFYPFGGPDLIFAFTFFPGAQDYVLFGLEKPGELCDPLKLTELQRRQYLDSLQFTYRYLNKFGFFVARQMLFDFQNKNIPLAEMNRRISEMLELFDDETENGKLFINYPMVEAIRYTKRLPDSDYCNYSVSREQCQDASFKELADEFSDYKSLDFLTLSSRRQASPKEIDSRKQNWRMVDVQNVSKANWICNDLFSVPENKDTISQRAIFSKQLEKFIVPSESVSILSAFPLFLFDYFPASSAVDSTAV